jgi:triacylglycerol lipase
MMRSVKVASAMASEIERAIRATGQVIDPPAAKAMYTPPLLADMPLGEEVKRDIAYGSGERRRLDLDMPVRPATPAPVVIFLHGGGFIGGDKGTEQRLATISHATVC